MFRIPTSQATHPEPLCWLQGLAPSLSVVAEQEKTRHFPAARGVFQIQVLIMFGGKRAALKHLKP